MLKAYWCKRQVARCLLATGRLVSWWTGNCFKRHGVWMDVSAEAIHPETRAALFWGLYESSERRAVRRFLSADIPVVELGASIGFITLQIAARLQGRKQIALEANPDLLPILNRNLTRNGMGHVAVLNGAINYEGTERCRLLLTNRTDGSHVLGEAEGGERVAEVRALTLEQLLKEQEIDAFALVADIEGSEYEIITREPAGMGARCRLAIMELHDVERDGRTWTREDIARLLCTKWDMNILFSDNKVWVFSPNDKQ